MQSLKDILDLIRQQSSSVAQKGLLFEKLIQVALKQHPEYADRFGTIYLFNRWPKRDASNTGIDLVAEETASYGGGLCAIQCKFYDSGNIPNTEIDKFLAEADNQRFNSKILVATDNYSKVAQRKLLNNQVAIITENDLNNWLIDADSFSLTQPQRLKLKPEKFQPKLHQRQAIEKVSQWFVSDETKGRLIMPCGTGKSLTALWLTEANLQAGDRVLYLVPSISLMNQTMKAWASQKSLRHRYIGVCSDVKAGRGENEDIDLTELSMPVTTDTAKIAQALTTGAANSLTVVFSTYQSLNKVCQAQLAGAPRFNLVICDEAHRTTGINKDDATNNSFLLVHDRQKLRADRRLYMTATQRIYTPAAKLKGATKNLDVYSMDDYQKYGPVIFQMQFGEAIDNNLLTDYRVVVIAYDSHQWHRLQNQYAQLTQVSISNQDLVAMIGLWDALATPTTEGLDQDRLAGETHIDHCRQGIVFTNSIKKSKLIADHWPDVIKTAIKNSDKDYRSPLNLTINHIDGTMNAFDRGQKLTWLKNRPGLNQVRLVTNARCLSEGVDVPSLDAVLFIDPKRSEIDIVQSVGRVMRKSANKKLGYIILPVIVPQDQTLRSHEYINSSQFNTVWKVLRALRSHDERLDTLVNSVHLAKRAKDRFQIIDKTQKTKEEPQDQQPADPVEQQQMSFDVFNQAVASAIVKNVGDRQYWPTWGKRVGQISHNVEGRILDLVARNQSVKTAYGRFSSDLEKTLETKVKSDYLSALAAQHIVTMPVFEALFGEDQFSQQNPVSVAIGNFINEINQTLNQEGSLAIETEELNNFYHRMKRQISQINDPQARLEVLKNLYESFFKYAMPKEASRLGIVYTPNEIVDFMIRFIQSICQDVFQRKQGISESGVNILDPFTGTGTFIYRLLTILDDNESFLIRDQDLKRKFQHELQAKEILLLAYYIANLKIEEGWRQRQPEDKQYLEFTGVTFTDTLKASMVGQSSFDFHYLKSHNARVERQNQIPIQIIIGNPPWSSGQDSASDNNPNIKYAELQQRVKQTYIAKHQQITGKTPGGNAAGNLYVKAIRWASDWISLKKKDESNYGSIIAFVHPNSLTDGPSLAGARASLMEEFTDIYVVNLRGYAYKSALERKKEGDGIFGSGSRNGVQITFLVKDPKKNTDQLANLHYTEVPDYQTRSEKFDWLAEIKNIKSNKFKPVKTDKKFNWVNISDGSFEKLLPVCATKTDPQAIAKKHASGIKTNLDYYVYAFNRSELETRMKQFINTYNRDLTWYVNKEKTVSEIVANADKRIIKWTDTLKNSLKQRKTIEFDKNRIRQVLYRPFVKMWLYEDDRILSSVKTISAMFPRRENQRSIVVTDGSNNGSTDSLIPPPPYSSPQTAAGPSSQSCQPPPSPICAQSAPINRPEQSPAGNKPGTTFGNISVRGNRQYNIARSPSARGRNEIHTQKQLVASSAILFHKNKQIPFGLLVSDVIVDLCVAGRDTRVVRF